MKKVRVILIMGLLTILSGLFSGCQVLDKGPTTAVAPAAGEVTLCSYAQSGGMDGSELALVLVRGDDGTATLTVTSRGWNDKKSKTKEYKVGADAIRAVSDLAAEYGVKDWGELPPAEYFAEDAPTRMITLELDGETFSFDNYKELPVPGAIVGFQDLLESFIPAD